MHSDLERVLRVLHARNLLQGTSVSDLAKIAGLARQTVSNAKSQFKLYLSNAPQPSKADIDEVYNQLLTLHVDQALNSGANNRHFAQVTGAVAGFALRYHTNVLDGSLSINKVVKVGQAYLSLACQITARKDNVGTPIHSQGKAAQYLLKELGNQKLVNALFSRSNGYQTGQYSKSWKLKDKALDINQRIKDLSIKLIEKDVEEWQASNAPNQVGSPICSVSTVTYPGPALSPEDRTIDVPLKILGTFSIPSFLQVMDIARHTMQPKSVAVPLANLANVDPNLGRTYNIFTRLRSAERKALGYMNYDISGGIQIICFNILSHYQNGKYEDFYDLRDSYPLIFSYGYDPEVKRSIREEIARDLAVSEDKVKSLLTAYANGSQKKVKNSEKLRQFFIESDRLRQEVMAVIDLHRPDVLVSALKQSKRSLPEDIDWQSIEQESSNVQARDKASVFFFVWTYFEKQVRDALLTLLDDGVPLHDAAYSKKKVLFADLEDVIRDSTGFDLKIRA